MDKAEEILSLYETTQDKTNALKAAQLFNNKVLNGRGIVYHFKKFSPVDIAIKDGDDIYVIEHKHRNHNFGEYPTIWLSYWKYYVLTLLPTHFKPIFMVTWADDFHGYIDLTKCDPVGVDINRRRSGDRHDDYEEIVLEFDVSDFIIF